VSTGIFVARHCHYRQSDGRLSEEGRLQAAAIAAKLAGERIGLILHSPSLRCEETARIVWECMGCSPNIGSVDWLCEDAEHSEGLPGCPGGGVLLVTHAPVVRRMTSRVEAACFGEVTRLDRLPA